MKAYVKNMNQVLTGIFLILVALYAFYLAWPLRSATAIGLGPGFVPKAFALIQAGIGVLLVVNGFMQAGDHESEQSAHAGVRPVIFVLAAVAFFAAAIETLGLVIAMTGLVLIGCAANRGTTIVEALAMAVGAVVVSVLLFVKALGLSIALWPKAF